MKDFVKHSYQKHYHNIGFDRSRLFELIQKKFNCQTVLYPGCYIHITPSFYFAHVVYVDRNQISHDFFTKKVQVTEFVNTHKKYMKSSYVKFLSKDYHDDLGLREQSYDLLISIFGGKLICSCEKYIKPGGLILTNSFFSDHQSIENNNHFELICSIHCYHGNYKIIDDQVCKVGKRKSTLKKVNSDFEYVDNENYYIYQKH
ncbi:hypothetical protein ACFL4L_06650 [bacterium]